MPGRAAATRRNSWHIANEIERGHIGICYSRVSRSRAHLFDIVAGLGAGLDEHDVQLLRLALALLGGHLPLVGQIGLVAHQHDDDVGAALRAHIIDPLGRLVE